MSQEIIDRIAPLVHAFDARVQAAPSGAWGEPSPCDGWTARDVVLHVSNSLNWLAGGLRNETPAAIGDDDDIVAAWDAASDRFLAAITTCDLSTKVSGPMGPMAAADLIGRFVATDVLVHTWDLARAVGGDERLDEAAVEAAYKGLKPMDAMIRRPGVFGARIDVEGADLQTEFLSFLGRTV